MLRFIARQCVKLIPNGTVVPILSGPLRGRRWTIGAGTNSCWVGTYENDKQRAFAEAVRNAASSADGCVVYDIGANVGFYTILAASCCGAEGQVHSFEPFPNNLNTLRRHVDLNRLNNVTVHAAAVSETSGTLSFAEGACPETGKLDESGSLAVTAIRLDDEVKESRLPAPDVVKIDVEGAEASVLRGMRDVLQNHKPLLLVALHSSAVRREVEQTLTDCGYTFTVVADDEPGFFELTGAATA